LGVTAPERPLDPDAPALGRAWITAREIGLVEINGDQAHIGPLLRDWHELTAEDTLDTWLGALVSELHATLPTVEEAEAAELAHTALEVLTGLESPRTEQAVTEALDERLQEDYSALADYIGPDFNLPDVVSRYRAGLPGELRAFGAVDDSHTVTDLGQWAMRELGSWQQDDSQTLDQLTDALVAAGIDPDDPDAVRGWLEQHPEELTSLFDDSAQDDGADDIRVIDLKVAFDLPDELPPISLPPRDEL